MTGRHRSGWDVHAELEAKVDELLTDLAWRARRYEMDGDLAARDVMREAHDAALLFLRNEGPMAS